MNKRAKQPQQLHMRNEFYFWGVLKLWIVISCLLAETLMFKPWRVEFWVPCLSSGE